METIRYVHTTNIHNTRAAEEVVPALINWFRPLSVVDVGCGLGTWLYVFKSLGVMDILGIDGHHLDTHLLVISPDHIILTDIEKPFVTGRKFDLALSLEVAEHLSDSSAGSFIESLTQLSDIIVFSAAIPNQGGQNHINEQWPEYWQSRFAEHGYYVTDEIRPLFWNNEKIDWWYKQNMLIAVKSGTPSPFKEIKPVLGLVHPDLLQLKSDIIRDQQKIIDECYQYIVNLNQKIEILESENRNVFENPHES